jgi:bifunctional UDP-N-acetylglucosamine pyrophosphorylase/glucosamine-1-phosphate N-acetyltransferase
MSALHVIILAAGQGTRMKSALPKVLHAVGGRPMLGHVVDTARAIGATTVHIVHGHGAASVREWFDHAFPEAGFAHWVMQAQQLGTAHAVSQAMPAVPDGATVLVLYADVPLISADTLRHLLDAAAQTGLALVTVELKNPAGYGRIVRNEEGRVRAIVEDKDANKRERTIREVNTGLLAADAGLLRRWLAKIGNDNAKHEFYLTDAIALAVGDGVNVRTISAANAAEVEGVNDRGQLAHLERVFQRRQAELLMRDGLALADPTRFDLRGTLRHGRDVAIDIGVVIEGSVELGDNVTIGPYCVLRNVRIGANTQVQPHSVLEDCVAGDNCRIGPFARLRPGTSLGRDAHVGNFVELKKSDIGDGAKVNHLAYLGDASVGARSNIGAGVITCNYDGASKHQTVIGADVFVGSDVQLVAPVTVGDGATIGAGSTITKEVPPGGLTVCRAREQKTHATWKRPVKGK